jgi:uncharacterized protein
VLNTELLARSVMLTATLLMTSACATSEPPKSTVRICDGSGCSDRPIDTATFKPETNTDPETERRMAQLTDLAQKHPAAAYDLGLRLMRGDGVRRSSYEALKWMRDAADRGDLKAQTAVGRLYLSGLEEMGSDPQEAEKWLSIAAGRGDKDAAKLLVEATEAKKKEQEYQRWLKLRREELRAWWFGGWPYRYYWRAGYWVLP